MIINENGNNKSVKKYKTKNEKNKNEN